MSLTVTDRLRNLSTQCCQQLTSSVLIALLLVSPGVAGAAKSLPPIEANHPAIVAAWSGNLAKLKEIVKATPSALNAKQLVTGSSTLMLAIFSGHTEVASYILAHSPATCLAQNNAQDSALGYAAANGRLESAAAIIKAAPQLLLVPNTSGKLPLHLAAEKKHTQLVSLFVEQPNAAKQAQAPDKNGNLPLHFAALTGDLTSTKLLAAFGHLAATNSVGNSPLAMAAVGGNKLVIENLLARNPELVLTANNQGVIPFFYFCRDGHLELVRQAAQAHPQVLSTYNKVQQNASFYAAAGGQVEVLKLLQELASGGLSKTDKNGATVLMFAAINKQHDVLAYLIDTIPQFALLADLKGNNAAHYSALNKSLDCTKLLLKRKPLLFSLSNKSGYLPGDVALLQQDTLLIDLLSAKLPTPFSAKGKQAAQKLGHDKVVSPHTPKAASSD